MQRQIKFRSWSNKLKSWIKSIVISDSGLPFIVFVEVNEAERTKINHIYTVDDHELVVQQFTGLLDVNNKEIYEGDIIIRHGERKAVEFFSGDSFDFQGFDIEQVFGKWEIIGNIFENPELLS